MNFISCVSITKISFQICNCLGQSKLTSSSRKSERDRLLTIRGNGQHAKTEERHAIDFSMKLGSRYEACQLTVNNDIYTILLQTCINLTDQ